MKKKEQQYKRLLTPEGERLLTELASEKEQNPWNVYPRPHMRRESFFCLNGKWELSVGEEPSSWEEITVPFVPESVLSGIGRRLPDGAPLHYRKRFSLPEALRDSRVLLHFDAVDSCAMVFLNGARLGGHCGGYERFTFDVTEQLREENLLTLRVTDALDGIFPYGKQKKKRGGMWYTPVSGIWQSVWMEAVPAAYIDALHVDSYADRAEVFVETVGMSADGVAVVQLPDGELTVPIRNGHGVIIPPDAPCWSPEDPYLYGMTVTVGDDTVESYFALRGIEVGTVDGIPRLCLNGRSYFFNGLLDQGYFSDGIFLPASPEGYERDILAAKRLGFNTLRKHIKVEPELFYYACDRLGMAVMQDAVNNGSYSFLRDTALPTVGLRRRDDRRMHRDPVKRVAFLMGMARMVKSVRHHPSVVMYTVFNEGWGQFDHADAYRSLKKLDRTRLVDSVSGWFLPPKGQTLYSDVESLHVYFKPFSMKETGAYGKPVILSEVGGYAWKVKDHSYQPKGEYGYRSFDSAEALREAVERLYRTEILPAVEQGLCAAIYTQLSDVEDEVNGLLTYDRQLSKLEKK